jgi:hypothetical protein
MSVSWGNGAPAWQKELQPEKRKAAVNGSGFYKT